MAQSGGGSRQRPKILTTTCDLGGDARDGHKLRLRSSTTYQDRR